MAVGRADSGDLAALFVAVLLLRDSRGFEGSGAGPLLFVVEAMKELAAPFLFW